MKKRILFCLIAILLVFSVSGCGSSSNGENYDDESKNGIENPKRELTESEKMINNISNLIDEGLAYDTGDYIKGDILPGEYAFIKFDGSGSYYSEEDAAGNIVDNENFDSFGYVKVHGVGNIETGGVLVSLSALNKLNVTGAKQLYEILNNQKNYNQGGYYKVDVDINSGQYLLESIGGSGYWAIMTGPISNSEIVDNDSFNGRASVNLKSGQYITLSRATITKQD